MHPSTGRFGALFAWRTQETVPRIDLALTPGIPGVAGVRRMVQEEMQVEQAAIATEAVVRTGECAPYANAILVADETFRALSARGVRPRKSNHPRA